MEDENQEEAQKENRGVSRRTLLRILIAVAVGIPILIESITFLRLLLSPDEDEEDGGDGTGDDAVGIGDEILKETPQEETISNAVVLVREENWFFSLGVEIQNNTQKEYRIEFGNVKTKSGKTFPSEVGSFIVEPEQTRTVESEWVLPEAEMPDEVTVTAVYSDEQGEQQEITQDIKLGKIPLQS